jgi:hypothetical protein
MLSKISPFGSIGRPAVSVIISNHNYVVTQIVIMILYILCTTRSIYATIYTHYLTLHYI